MAKAFIDIKISETYLGSHENSNRSRAPESFPAHRSVGARGESINISKRGKVIATLIPATGDGTPPKTSPKVDFMARLRETWGDRVFTIEQVAALRADELAGGLG